MDGGAPEMTTIMKIARSGSITDEMKIVARQEGLSPEIIRNRVARGKIIIPHNRDNIKIIGIGEGLSTKVNVNIGTSTLVVNPKMELEKLRVALKYGTDTVMDLSTGGDLRSIRLMLLKEANIPFGTVPIYQAFIETAKKKGAGIYMDEDDIFNVIEEHLKDGVDFATIHAGITKDLVEKFIRTKRLAGIPSRGGSILAAWILHHDEENPLYKNYDYLLELFAEYDATISLGDALRPGSIADAHDELQVGELLKVAELVRRAREAGVQVMVEGPGHVPLDKIIADVKIEKSLCDGAPYYVLGPLPTDIAMGYDHIASAVGAAIAAAYGADLLCYLTPAEHLSLPNVEQVKEGLIAAKIAAHIADIVKIGERALKQDIAVSKARAELNWKEVFKYSLDPEYAKKIHKQYGVPTTTCTMCGDLCVYRILEQTIKNKRARSQNQ